MIILPNGKICMNEQEAISWLLDNYPIPFQCSANYVGGAEIGLGTIVNPTPAKVKVGSIIFFADSKVSTVVAVNANSFVCSEQYNDLVDDVVYVSNVQLNASGHLIVTLSNDTTIDAGLIKQVSSFSINASQQLVVTYNDGTSTNLGAIFAGNVNIAGNFTADSIIENMVGYGATHGSTAGFSITDIYTSVCKNGNKITFASFVKINKSSSYSGTNSELITRFTIPTTVGAKLYPYSISGYSNMLEIKKALCVAGIANQVSQTQFTLKQNNATIDFMLEIDSLTANEDYLVRIEQTFLLSDNLVA